MEAQPLFRDRREAGRRLATLVRRAIVAGRPLVLGLPRGGVPIADEVARALDAELDVLNVRKLGVPGHEELAMGAVASGGAYVLNEDVIAELGISAEVVAQSLERRTAEVAVRDRLFRGDRPRPDVRGATVVLVDDGLATGATMRAAIEAVRRLHPARIVVAVPVAARDTADALRPFADAFVCLATPEPFRGVGLWYASFPQLSEDEVRAILRSARSPQGDDARIGRRPNAKDSP